MQMAYSLLKEEAKDRICTRLPEFCKKTAGLVRNLVFFCEPSGAIIKNKIILQYYIDTRIASQESWSATRQNIYRCNKL